MNEDMVTWESDYPHSDCTWPHSPETTWEGLKHLTKEQIDKVTHLNAMRQFSYDPFSIMKREDCTVAALRAKAAHVSTEPALGLGGAEVTRKDGKPVTSGDINAMFETADAKTAI